MQQQTRSQLWFWLGAILFALLLCAGIVVYFIGRAVVKVGEALETDTRVAVRPVTTNGTLELEFKYGNEVTGINTITVTDADGTKLWEVSGQGAEKPPKIVYGQLPTAGTTTWKQVFPEDKPPADVRGKKVQIRVVNRFQVAFGPGQEVSDLTVDVPK